MDPESGTRPQDPSTTAAIADVVAPLDDLAARHRELTKAVPAIGSAADADAAVSSELGHEPRDFASDRLSSALDHLTAWRDLIGAGRQPTFAHLTLIRASLEAGVTVRWLIDRAASPKERVARAVALLADDYEERRKAENSMAAAMRALGREPKVPVPPGMTAAARKAELEAQRIADGLAAYQSPPYTRLLETHGLPGGDRSIGDYRVLSGHAHGLRWRLLLNPSEDAGPTGGPTLRRVVTASDPLAVRMTRLGMAYVETAMVEAEAYVSAPVGPDGLAATGGGIASPA